MQAVIAIHFKFHLNFCYFFHCTEQISCAQKYAMPEKFGKFFVLFNQLLTLNDYQKHLIKNNL